MKTLHKKAPYYHLLTNTRRNFDCLTQIMTQRPSEGESRQAYTYYIIMCYFTSQMSLVSRSSEKLWYFF